MGCLPRRSSSLNAISQRSREQTGSLPIAAQASPLRSDANDTIRPLPVATVASFLAVGIPYWQIPYCKINLPDTLLVPGFVVAAILAVLLGFRGSVSPWRSTWVLGIPVAAAVFVRVLVDGMRGSCLCQSIEYEITQLDSPIEHCSCGTCRKAHAAAFNTAALVKHEIP